MSDRGLKKVSHNTFVLSQLDDSREISCLLSDSLAEALYLYILIPFPATHVLTVNICTVPFCIPSHRGQVVYHAEAFYTQCCQGLSKTDLMPILTSTAQRTYSIYMSHHTWNFDIPDVWSVIPVPVIIPPSRSDSF